MMLIHSPVVRPLPVCFPGPSDGFGVVFCGVDFGLVVCVVDIDVVVRGSGPWPHPFAHAHFVVRVDD